MQLFFLDNPPDEHFTLSKEESRHLARVLRKKRGDLVRFTDGRGMEFRAEIIDDNHSAVELKLVDQLKHEPPKHHFHLAIALTKKLDRIEWCIEKCVEMGMTELTLLLTDRTEVARVRQDRLQRIALAAMKQSQQFFLPKLNLPESLEEFLGKKQEGDLFIAHCEETDRVEFSAYELGEKTTVLIGPEGDFTPDEIKRCLEEGIKPVALGNSRLRTETAGMFACAVWRHKTIDHET